MFRNAWEWQLFWSSPRARGVSVLGGLLQVTLLGVSKMIDKCIRGRRQQSKLNPRADYACFEEYHFQPMVVTTQPYEPLSHATLEWLKENQDKCDVLQVRPQYAMYLNM